MLNVQVQLRLCLLFRSLPKSRCATLGGKRIEGKIWYVCFYHEFAESDPSEANLPQGGAVKLKLRESFYQRHQVGLVGVVMLDYGDHVEKIPDRLGGTEIRPIRKSLQDRMKLLAFIPE